MMLSRGRTLTAEWMDDPKADRAELSASLRFLRRVNGRLGGASALLGVLARDGANWPRDRAVRLLDLGTGSADIPQAVVSWARRRGHRVVVTAVDAHEGVIDLAREHLGDEADIELVHADALSLRERFDAGSFDYVHAGLFLHHLQDVEVMTMLAMMDRLASRRAIVNDLVRGVVGAIGVRLCSIGAPGMVKHDGPASVRAGFRKREMLAMAHKAGWRSVQYRTHFCYRFTLVGGGSSAMVGGG